jgi:hypothetical protein
MSNITSGVNHDFSLFMDLKVGPSSTGILFNSYWPEVTPGYFTAGNTIHNNADYLFARENRVITDSVSGLFTLDSPISRTQGPILAAWCPNSVSGQVYTQNVGTSGWVSRDSNFIELIYSVCRNRLIHPILNFTLVSSTTYDLYSYTVSGEAEGFGPISPALMYKVEDKSEEWQNYKFLPDFIEGAIPGMKTWCPSGNTLYVKVPVGASAPTGLSVSYISGQASLDVEEYGLTTIAGVPISVGTKDRIDNVEIQLAYGGALASGSIVASGSVTFPRYVNSLGLPENTPVIIRYRPTGVYGTTIGTVSGVRGVIVAGNLSSSGKAVFRFDKGIIGEKHSPGSVRPDMATISPVASFPGFYLGVAPNHYLHSLTKETVLNNGNAPSFSKVFAWASHTNLTTLNAPIAIRCLVIGQDDVPVPFTNIYVDYPVQVTGSSVVTTNLNGEVNFQIYKKSTSAGVVQILLSIQSSGNVIDVFTLNLNLQPLVSNWREKFMVGKVHISELSDLPKSAVSNRRQLSIYRTLADGSPSPYHMNTVTIFCKKGRLFSTYNNNIVLLSSNSGSQISLKKSANQSSKFDEPIYIEYESADFGNKDIITVVWESDSLSPAYGTYQL